MKIFNFDQNHKYQIIMNREKRINYSQSIKYLMVLPLSVLLLGCSSIDVERVRALDKVAVPMITVGKYINMGKFDLGSAIQRLAEDDKFDLQPALDDLHEKTYNDFATSLPFDVVEEKKLLESDAYKNFNPFSASKKNVYKPSSLLTPEGYMKYHPDALNKRKRAKVLKVIPDEADAAMFVYITYDLEKRKIPMLPIDKAAVKANINMDIYDRNGERILKVRKSAESDDDIKAVAGVLTDTDKIKSMTLNATNKALRVANSYIRSEL